MTGEALVLLQARSTAMTRSDSCGRQGSGHTCPSWSGRIWFQMEAEHLSACCLPTAPPTNPHPGRATFPWNDANGVIRVSVSKIKSVTPFCRLIISTFQAARRQHNTRRGGCFLSRLTQIYSCVCVCVCVCACACAPAHMLQARPRM